MLFLDENAKLLHTVLARSPLSALALSDYILFLGAAQGKVLLYGLEELTLQRTLEFGTASSGGSSPGAVSKIAACSGSHGSVFVVMDHGAAVFWDGTQW